MQIQTEACAILGAGTVGVLDPPRLVQERLGRFHVVRGKATRDSVACAWLGFHAGKACGRLTSSAGVHFDELVKVQRLNQRPADPLVGGRPLIELIEP